MNWVKLCYLAVTGHCGFSHGAGQEILKFLFRSKHHPYLGFQSCVEWYKMDSLQTNYRNQRPINSSINFNMNKQDHQERLSWRSCWLIGKESPMSASTFHLLTQHYHFLPHNYTKLATNNLLTVKSIRDFS